MPLDPTLDPNDPTAGVPQAQIDTVARGLLGDDLVNRYGDVLGAREPTLVDGLRDFVIGSTHGVGALEELREKQRANFQDQLVKRQRAALAREQADRKAVTSSLDALLKVQQLPPGHRANILKEVFDANGVAYTPTSLKMLADSDVMAQLDVNKLVEAASTGAFTLADMSGVTGNALNTAKFLSEFSRMQTDDIRRDQMALNMLKTRQEMGQSAVRFAERNQEKGGGGASDTKSLKREKLQLDIEGKRLANKEKKLKLRKAKDNPLGLPPDVAQWLSPTGGVDQKAPKPAAPTAGAGAAPLTVTGVRIKQ